jgi:hypothetical protein
MSRKKEREPNRKDPRAYLKLLDCTFSDPESVLQEFGKKRGPLLYELVNSAVEQQCFRLALHQLSGDGDLTPPEEVPEAYRDRVRLYIESAEARTTALQRFGQEVPYRQRFFFKGHPWFRLVQVQEQLRAIVSRIAQDGAISEGDCDYLIWHFAGASYRRMLVQGKSARLAPHITVLSQLIAKCVDELVTDIVYSIPIRRCDHCPRFFIPTKSDNWKCDRCPASSRVKAWRKGNRARLTEQQRENRAAARNREASRQVERLKQIREASAALRDAQGRIDTLSERSRSRST